MRIARWCWSSGGVASREWQPATAYPSPQIPCAAVLAARTVLVTARLEDRRKKKSVRRVVIDDEDRCHLAPRPFVVLKRWQAERVRALSREPCDECTTSASFDADAVSRSSPRPRSSSFI